MFAESSLWPYGNTLALVDNTLIIRGANVEAYDLETDERVWERNLLSSNGLTVTSRGLLCDSVEKTGHFLYLLDVNSGKTIWKTGNTGGWGYRRAVNGDRLVCDGGKRFFYDESAGSSLYCIDLKTGRKLWRASNPGPGQPIILDNVVYSVGYKAGSASGPEGDYLYALDLSLGSMVDAYPLGFLEFYPPVTDGQYIYIIMEAQERFYKFQKIVQGGKFQAPIILPVNPATSPEPI